jgi:hypothetical protein
MTIRFLLTWIQLFYGIERRNKLDGDVVVDELYKAMK